MILHRAVPNLTAADPSTGHGFYTDYLGLRVDFDLGWVTSFRSPTNRHVQLSLVGRDATAPENAQVSIGVADVDAAYAEAVERGYEIVHPLTEEAWGIRRFLVREPHGAVVNILRHRD